MREQYTKQLQQLHEAMLHMGELCCQVIELAIQALTNWDKALIIKEQEIDAEIDKMEREIESRCLQLLLKQQPVAGDLRDISAALKMISDMERIGDQATDIAEIAAFLQGSLDLQKTDLARMAREAIRMVQLSIAAFVDRDPEIAGKVIAYDDVVDRFFAQIKSELITLIAAHPEQGEACLDLLMVAKYLERIGDHATNIAEWVEYSVLGKRSKDGVM